jgi:hypothetical protein
MENINNLFTFKFFIQRDGISSIKKKGIFLDNNHFYYLDTVLYQEYSVLNKEFYIAPCTGYHLLCE